MLCKRCQVGSLAGDTSEVVGFGSLHGHEPEIIWRACGEGPKDSAVRAGKQRPAQEAEKRMREQGASEASEGNGRVPSAAEPGRSPVPFARTCRTALLRALALSTSDPSHGGQLSDYLPRGAIFLLFSLGKPLLLALQNPAPVAPFSGILLAELEAFSGPPQLLGCIGSMSAPSGWELLKARKRVFPSPDQPAHAQ